MNKLVFLVVSILLYLLYLVYSYNELSGRSYLYEPVCISLKGNIPANTSLELIYQTINDPTKIKHVYPLVNDSIPEDVFIFKIDSSYRLASFSIYFRNLPNGERCTIRQVEMANNEGVKYSFSLKAKDLIATKNLQLDQYDSNAISISKAAIETSGSTALSFSVRASFYGVFVRTNTRIPEIPSLIPLLLIVILGLLMAYALYPVFINLNLKKVSLGAYSLAMAIFILPTGEKICNLLLIIALGTGIITSFISGSFRSTIKDNRRILFPATLILLVYTIAFVVSRGDSASGAMLAIKFGLPLAFFAVAMNTNNPNEIQLQFAAMLAGIIISVFIHLGWIVMFVDSVEIKARLFSNPRYFLESSVFSRVHHSYLSVIYLVGLMILYFRNNLLLLRSRVRVIFTILIISSMLFAFSRAGVLSLGLVLLFLATKRISQLVKFEVTFLARIVTAAALTLALLAIIYIDINVGSPTEMNAIKGFRTRMNLWGNAAEIIKQKPLTGWGPGDFIVEFQQSNSQNFINSNTWQNLNTHNQFLETSGMFGLLVGVGVIWFLLFPTGFLRRYPDYSDFIFTVAIIFITGFIFESFLNRNLGILTFGIVYGLLMKSYPESNDELQINV